MADYSNQSFSDISSISDSHYPPSMENVPLEDMNFGNKLPMQDNEFEKIREALNRQTLIQYRQFAIEKYPKEIVKQEELVTELQNQHFKNYWTNVHLDLKRHQIEQIEQKKAMLTENSQDVLTNEQISELITQLIMPATLWTRKDVSDFKSNILTHQRSNCIKIQSLSTATIKVPTHKDGRCIFWEFATDYYDIGFGLVFEWNLNPSDNVVVTISESSDEETLNDDSSKITEAIQSENSDEVNQTSSNSETFKSPEDELITTYRRESHMEVYCGSHEHPGSGYYILKFDNSYSVWRSKWLYYNIYHTK